MKTSAHVLVTPGGPDDGGDFGPGTRGTRTSGIQEALNHAKASKMDVYVSGGGLTKAFGGGVSYVLEETLRIPWNQNWRLDGGEYWLFYRPEDGDAVVIDSQMNCRIKMGLIVNALSPGAVVRMCPSSKGPDGMRCIVASTFEFNGMVGAGDVWGKPGAKQQSTGLMMDCTKGGGISGNRISLGEINACDLGIHLTEGCHGNHIEATWIHLANLGIRIGDDQAANVSRNVIRAGVSGDLPGTTGVEIFGHRNFLTIEAHANDANRNIVFEKPARDNLIVGVDLPNGITNNAEVPTNRIRSTAPMGYSIGTPPMPPSGERLVNRHPYVVEAQVVNAGDVTGWRLTDPDGSSQEFSGGLFTGQTILLEPGDSVVFNYTKTPEWRWRALAC